VSRTTFPEPVPFNGDDLRDLPSVETHDDEQARELEWARLEADARDFASRYGAGALLRCISRALDQA
jgi:hypothetical protein